MKKLFADWKVIAGILLSIFFLYIAFSHVQFKLMWEAFKSANYWYIIPAVLLMFLSHWWRSVRWRFLMEPVQYVETRVLFSALLVGYMANTFLPAHLGEFLRAYMVGKKRSVSSSAVFATIVVERLIDVFTLLVLMALTIIVFPFPDWVKTSGYLSLVGVFVLFGMLVLMKRNREKTLELISKIMKPFPDKWSQKLHHLVYSFLDGIVPLKRKSDYFWVTVLSILIWACYMFIFQVSFYAFNFINLYHLPWTAALVLLVITTISVLVPSSPGYVGTYHYLCQLSLGLFAVPESPALTFAFVVHGINFLPILIVGLIILSKEGMNIKSLQSQSRDLKQV